MIRLAPCSIAAHACSKSDSSAASSPAPSAAGKSIGSVTDVNPRQSVELLEPGQLVVVEDRQVERDLAAALRAWASSRFPSPPAPVKTDVTSSSRIASSGGLVTWAKSCLK